MRSRLMSDRPLAVLGLTAILVSLVGCATAPPTDRTIEGLHLPEAWEGRQPAAATPGFDAWWRSFEDGVLDQLIDEVLTENLDLAAAAARLDAAVAQARVAGASLGPQVAAGFDGARRKQVFIGLPIPGREGTALSNTSTSYGVSLNLSWEADLWGRLRHARSGARALAEAAAADLGAARLSLAGQTAKAWFSLLTAQQQVVLAEETVASRRSTTELIERRYQRGLRSALDLRLARSAEAAAQATVAARKRQLDGAVRQINLLLSRYPNRALEFEMPPELSELPPAPRPGLPAELLSRRPDLAAVESRLRASGYGVAEAKAALFPRLTLTGSTGRLSPELDDLLDSDFSVWSLAGGLLQPLFQSGRLRAAVDLSEARFKELAALYARSILGACAEVETALAAAEQLDQQYDALSNAADEADRAAELAESRYRRGVSDYLAVLEAQRQRDVLRSQFLDIARDRFLNRIDLHLALGGGWGGTSSSAGTEPGSFSKAPTETKAVALRGDRQPEPLR